MTHSHALRVYHEDTDLAGIVCYANHLKIIERGRTEWVASLGIDQMALRAAEGVVFAVRRVEADFLRPARFGDGLAVETTLQAGSGARLVLEQVVLRAGERLFSAVVTLVCLKGDGHAARMPAVLRARLAGSAGGLGWRARLAGAAFALTGPGSGVLGFWPVPRTGP